MYRFLIPLACAACWTAPAAAATLDLRVQIPQLDVAEYHRPYIAAWIEGEDRKVLANLLVWYQQEKRGAPPGAESGTKWLPDLRQWWRRSGRDLQMPVDGVSSATRPVGTHELRFTAGEGPLPTLATGRYRLRVEAAREEGGRELLEIPFEWPMASAQTLTAEGRRELGTVAVTVSP